MNCLIQPCKLPVLARGLCRRHYNSCRHRVAKGQTTWDKLADRGMAIREKSKTRKRYKRGSKGVLWRHRGIVCQSCSFNRHIEAFATKADLNAHQVEKHGVRML